MQARSDFPYGRHRRTARPSGLRRAGLAIVVLALLLAIGAAGGTAPAGAAGVTDFLTHSTTDTGSDLDKLISAAKKDGSTVVVINPEGAQASDGASATMSMMHTNAMLLEARYNLLKMIRQAETLPQQLESLFAKASPDGTWMWLVRALATALAGILLGLGVYKLIVRYIRKNIAARRLEESPNRANKLRFLLTRAALVLLSSVVMFAVTVFVAVVFDSGEEATRLTILNIVVAYASYRVLRYVIMLNFFAPDLDQYRMIHIDGGRARRLYRDWYRVIGIAVVVMGTIQWLYDLGLQRSMHSLLFIAGLGICALLVAGLTVRHRHDLVEIVRSDALRRGQRRFRETLARVLVPVILVYLAAAWLVSTFRLSLGLRSGYILVVAPILVFIVAIFVYGMAMYVLEIFYERREMRFRRRRVVERLRRSRTLRQAAAAARVASSAAAGRRPDDDEDDEDLRDEEEMVVFRRQSDAVLERQYRPIFKRFFEGSIGALILTVAIGELVRIWGVDIGRSGHPLALLLDSALLVVVGLLALRSINDFIDVKLTEEGGGDDAAMPAGDGEAGVGQTRLATLLPIFRAMLIGFMAIVAMAILLINLGVDIAPLFAGAGVVGLAIGFGAQTLIRDVFSGLFFLIDDAFRKGEYIAVGEVQGVIEKISIRSFQLRHHRGALQTVPFGEIQHLTNFSRDWVMMKLPLRVTYGTDVEKVRKLIKKLGHDLLEDPEVGQTFLQPLKSQGVYSMEDSAMIIRVKFMTRPGDQFVTRKVVYAAIRELFAREGIQFAHREVTVRLADDVKVNDLTPGQREAIAGAVRPVLDDEAAEMYGSGAAAAASER